jgi:outer membrane lipase/esterase
VAPDVVNRFEIPSASNRVYWDAAGGISARVGDHIAIEGTVHNTFSQAEGDVYGGFAGVGFPL